MRRVMEIFPASMTRLWNEWELRVLVIVSLLLQIVLTVLGNRRKYISQNWIRVVLWLAYLAADWVAAVCIGILWNSQGDGDANGEDVSSQATNVIWAFWAPFLLLHLGGPDAITAYSLEDNELWLRHLLGLVIQFGGASYVFLKSWKGMALNFLAIPVFVVGLIKYGERTWVLRSASSKHFREAMLPLPDPGPSYVRLMGRYVSTINWEGTRGPRIETFSTHRDHVKSFDPGTTVVKIGHCFFMSFNRLFADLILTFQVWEWSRSFFLDTSWKTAFEVIEVELGFAYDVLYTKAGVTNSRWGYLLRSITLSFTISTFIAFFLLINKHEYSIVDLIITFILLVGAIILEIYAIIVLLSSDWSMCWLSEQGKWVKHIDRIQQALSCCQLPILLPENKRWSDSMAQYNLLSLCLKGKPIKFLQVKKLIGIYHGMEEKYYDKSWTIVPPDLKGLIFEQLKNKSTSLATAEACKQLCNGRGNLVLESMNCFEQFGWSIEVDFDQSILLWHIATDICHYTDQKRNSYSELKDECKALSDYMLYLLVMNPLMLPQRLGQIRFRDTCKVMALFQDRKQIMSSDQACEELLRSRTQIPPLESKVDKSKSVLSAACDLAESLQLLQTEEEWDCKRKWEMMSHVWVEMLCYAANQCPWNHHAKQLRRGGELISHVWLLMAHFGMSRHFLVPPGPWDVAS